MDTTEPDWTKNRIQKMIDDKIEEGTHLDYKAAGALDRKVETKKTDITKDVSSFANSAGGTIIYGVKEFPKPKNHLPEKIDPIDGREYSKEWLQDIIGGISPKIEGLQIFAVRDLPDPWQSCYVVDIPQSTTAHMARDFRYYRRYNFESVPMEDHEVRDVMNRRRHPKLDFKISVKHTMDMRLLLAVRTFNRGTVVPQRYGASVLLPTILGGTKTFRKDVTPFEKDGRQYWRVFIEGTTPLFPTLDTVNQIELHCLMKTETVPEPPGDKIFCTLYADDMPPAPREIPAAFTHGWV